MWISVGSLLRKAVHMGLHRDPIHLPKRTIFAAEMRRRLWNTILEIALQSSLFSGGPMLISPNEFDTAPPGNFDDDQLVADDPIAKAEDQFTQVSIAIALRNTFPARLAVIKFLNNLPASGTYEETLQLDTQFRTAYKALNRTLQAYNRSSSPLQPSVSSLQFEMRVVDLILLRYLSSLHLPYFGPGLDQAMYAFSRRVVVDSSLKIWRLIHPLPSHTLSTTTIVAAAAATANPHHQESNTLARLSSFSSGLYPVLAIHAAILIIIELQTHLKQEESLGPVSVRPDLLSVLEEAKTWTRRVVETGETNIKGFLLMCVMAAQIKGLMNGESENERAEALVKAAEYSIETCLPMLEEMAAELRRDAGGNDEEQQGLMLATPGDMEDWNFLVSYSDYSDCVW